MPSRGILGAWRAALQELEGFLTSPDPLRVEAGVKIIFAKFLTIISLPLLIAFAVHFLRRGMRLEAATMVFCAVSNTAAYLFIWDRLRRGAPPRVILAAFRAAAIVFLVAWGAQHAQVVAVGGRAEYAPWVVLFPFIALLLLARVDAAVLLAVYLAAFAGIVLGSGRGFAPLTEESQGILAVNIVFAFITAGVIQALAIVVNRIALRSMAEVRCRLEASEARNRETNRELESARDAAVAASRAKTEFLARMSHEIRTPMNAILGMTELLLHSELARDQRTRAETISASGSALMNVLNDVLDLSRIEANRLGIEAVPYDPAAVVRSAAELFRSPSERKGLAFSCVVAPGVPDRVVGDPHRTSQVIHNLLSNAIQHTASGGITVRVSTEDGGRALRFEVLDSGSGIAPEDQGRIFDEFTQAGSYATREHGGAGLGLAIARRLVGMMGGTIGVESEPGQGSLFFFTLPVVVPVAGCRHGTGRPEDPALPARPILPAAVPAAAQASPSVRSDPGGRARNVLIVEDNPTNQALAREMLEMIGCGVEIAADGKAAVEAVSATSFDLVLMDCQMPVMDGYEATARIRSSKAGAGRRVPIVALTGHAMAGERERCLGAGMDDYLSKPFSLAQLQAVVERWVPSGGG